MPRALALVLIAVAVTAAALGSRWLVLQRALQHRGPVCQLLPTDTFNPSPEEVAQHAATVLGRVRRVTRSLGTQRANAVRLRLELVAGEVVYGVEGPERARSLLRQSGFREVEVLLDMPTAGDEEVDGLMSDIAATPPQGSEVTEEMAG